MSAEEDGMHASRDWTQLHPDAPAGGGPGWQTLDSIADYGGALLEFDEEGADWFESLSVPEQVRTFYTQSDCDDFAVALHRITGWPLVLATFPDNEMGIGHHVLAQAPDGRLVDAAGWHGYRQLREALGGSRVRFSTPGSEELAQSANIGQDMSVLVSDDDTEVDERLAMAVSAIRQLPWAPFVESEFRALSTRPMDLVDPVGGSPGPVLPGS